MEQIATWNSLQQWAFRIFEWYSRCIGARVCDPKQACHLLPLTRLRLPEISEELGAPLEYRDRLSIALFCRMSICLLLSSTIALSFYLMTIAQALSHAAATDPIPSLQGRMREILRSFTHCWLMHGSSRARRRSASSSTGTEMRSIYLPTLPIYLPEYYECHQTSLSTWSTFPWHRALAYHRLAQGHARAPVSLSPARPYRSRARTRSSSQLPTRSCVRACVQACRTRHFVTYASFGLVLGEPPAVSCALPAPLEYPLGTPAARPSQLREAVAASVPSLRCDFCMGSRLRGRE